MTYVRNASKDVSYEREAFQRAITRLICRPVLHRQGNRDFREAMRGNHKGVVFILPIVFPVVSINVFLTLVLVLIPTVVVLYLYLRAPPKQGVLPVAYLRGDVLVPGHFVKGKVVRHGHP